MNTLRPADTIVRCSAIYFQDRQRSLSGVANREMEMG